MAAQVAKFALQIVSLTVLARLLTPTQFGVVAMVTSVTGVAELIRDFGLSSAAIQAKNLTVAERDNLLWVNTAIGAACAAVVALLAPALGLLYGDDRVVAITWALAWLFIVSGLNTQYKADLTRSLRFGPLAVVDIVSQAVGIAAAIGLALAGAGYWAIVAQQVTVVVLSLVLSTSFCRWLPGRPRRSVSLRRFFGFGGSVLSTQLMGYALNNLDNVAIGARWGADPLGLYTRGFQLLQVPLTQINAPLQRVALPVLSRLQDDRAGLQRYVDRFQLLSCYTLGLGFAVAAGLADPLVGFLFGDQWHAVAPIFTLLAIGGIFKCFSQVTYQVFLAKGLTRLLFVFYAWSRPLMLVVILAGLPWGPVGVAATHIVAAVGSWLASLWLIHRHAGLDWRPQFTQSLRALVLLALPAGVLAHVAAGALAVPPALQLVAGGLAAAAWAALVGAVIPPLRRDLAHVVAAARLAVRR